MTDTDNRDRDLVECQRRRNERLACGVLSHFVVPPLVRFTSIESPIWREDTTSLSPAADAFVTLQVSPFPGRPPTIVFLPFDRPWDGDPCCVNLRAYVEPTPLPPLLVPFHAGHRCTVQRDGAYAVLRFAIPTGAVRFSSILATLERAGFTEARSLVATTWCVKWCKHPVRSDFVRLLPFQRINRFPGTWRLGKKDALHGLLLAAREKWQRSPFALLSPPFGDIFPDGWVLPEDGVALTHVLRSTRESGNIFIVKPTTSACGRGIHLIQAHENQHLPIMMPPTTKGKGDGEAPVRRGTGRLVVQRYVPDPLLVEGYKFDLRIYVLVTSYYPLRAYMYEEGLVRFATSLYPKQRKSSMQSEREKIEEGGIKSEGGGGGGGGGQKITSRRPSRDGHLDFTDERALTAHLTNFTLNKKSEDFVSPTSALSNGNESSTSNGGMASKWTFAALRAHFMAQGLNWTRTMAKVHDLLVKVLLSVEPYVVGEIAALQQPQSPNGPRAARVDVGSRCFELYGADVLLRGTSHEVAEPILMEMNVMPSLSTHYSTLDQCVKGNLIADAFTLVGVTPPGAYKRRSKNDEVSYGHAFLDALHNAAELEACLIAEEEFERRTHFARLCPTAESYEQFKPLFDVPNDDAPRVGRSLNEVLSAWEKAKQNARPSWNSRRVSYTAEKK